VSRDAPAGRDAASGRAVAGHLRPTRVLVALLVLVAAAPFALNLAGDAQVHLTIAEAFVRGHPFQFNPGGERVVASTSPFWTMMLALYFRLAGNWTPALLTATAVILWLAAGYVLYRAARDLWGLHGIALWAVVLLWLAHTTIVANALGGLENVAAALQLLLLYYVVGRTADPRLPTGDRQPETDDRQRSTGRSLPFVLMGLLLGWALLTRPDGGLFALLVVALALPLAPVRLRKGRRSGSTGQEGETRGQEGKTRGQEEQTGGKEGQTRGQEGQTRGSAPTGWGLVIILVVAAAVLVPWFAYQYAMTGRVLTDSSIARLYNGRMGSLMLIPDLLYLHPKPLLSLASAFLPLAVGFLFSLAALAEGILRARGRRLTFYRARWPQMAAVALVLAGFAFYTAVVGAEAFGRYFLPLFPFFFLAGVDGLRRAAERLVAAGRRRVAVLIVALALLFLAATGALDYFRRLGPGRFAPASALDVIRGPADRRYYAANVPFLIRAPQQRGALTDEFFNELGAAGAARASIAVTEVQLRYFLDDRVTVLSLDGRTSADILRYVDPTSGVPDFGRYFEVARPDYVHIRQWCAVGGWLADLFPARIQTNLVCDWERRAATMLPGESFGWQGQRVTLVAPDIVRIDWEGS